MLKISSITALGLLIAVVASPVVAIPTEWKEYIFIFAGILVFGLSIFIRKELNKVIKLVHGIEDIKVDTYAENNPQ